MLPGTFNVTAVNGPQVVQIIPAADISDLDKSQRVIWDVYFDEEVPIKVNPTIMPTSTVCVISCRFASH